MWPLFVLTNYSLFASYSACRAYQVFLQNELRIRSRFTLCVYRALLNKMLYIFSLRQKRKLWILVLDYCFIYWNKKVFLSIQHAISRAIGSIFLYPNSSVTCSLLPLNAKSACGTTWPQVWPRTPCSSTSTW